MFLVKPTLLFPPRTDFFNSPTLTNTPALCHTRQKDSLGQTPSEISEINVAVFIGVEPAQAVLGEQRSRRRRCRSRAGDAIDEPIEEIIDRKHAEMHVVMVKEIPARSTVRLRDRCSLNDMV